MDVAGMQNARLGVIYLWQGTTVESPLANVILSGAMGAASGLAGLKEVNLPVPDLATDFAAIGVQSAINVREGPQQGLSATIKAWAEDFLLKVWDKIKDIFGDLAEMAGQLKKIAVFVTQQVFKKLAPVIGSAVGLVQGLWKMTVAFCEKLGDWLAARGVKLVQGHPTTLIKGIESGITRALLEGIYEMAKSAASLALNVASWGGTAIVDAVVAVVEAATKIIWRIAETFVIRRFCKEARQFWIARNESNSIHLDSSRFDGWLKGTTNKVPVIAAVTLGTGIAGDKMRFLQMYTGEGAVISQDQFDAGVKYLDQMKRAGSRLLERSDMKFHTDDKVIDGLLKLAQRHDAVAAQGSLWQRLFRFTDKAVRA